MPPDSATFGGDRRLADTRFGDVRWVERTGSTNSDALALARDGAPEGVVVVADFQEGGRGRRGRSWVAPAGSSLLVSLLLRPSAPLAGLVTTAVGVAMVEAVEQVSGVVAGLKWPNDMLVAVEDGPGGERKLGGILAETDWPPGASISGGWREPTVHERVAVVVGVGLNVNWPDPSLAGATGGPGSEPTAGPEDGSGAATTAGAEGTDLPAEVLDTGTALNWIVGRDIDRVELLVAFLCRLEEHYGTMMRERSGGAALAAWRARSLTLGRQVRVGLGPDDVEGTAVDVTEEGHLVVDTLEGTRRTLAAGEVVHLRSG